MSDGGGGAIVMSDGGDIRQDQQIRLNSDTTAVRVTAAISQAGAGAFQLKLPP